VLLFIALFAVNVKSLDVTYAARIYHGWSVTAVTSNRFDQTGIFIDSGKIVRTVPSTSDPSQSQPIFNFTSIEVDIQVMTASRNRHAWIYGLDTSGWIIQDYLLYVDLSTSAVKFNISTRTFKPSAGWLENLAVDSKDNVYAVTGNNVWSFDTNGKQINYFQLNGRGNAWNTDIDIDDQNNLWILEDFNRSSQANRLLQYTTSGELIYSSDVKFPDIQRYLVNVAVDSAGIAYFTAYNESRVLSWSTVNNTRGADIPFKSRPNPRQNAPVPQLTLLSDSTLVVGVYGSPDVLVVNVRDSSRSYTVSSPTPPILGPAELVAVGKTLIVSSEQGLLAMSPDTGSITATLGDDSYLYGLTSDQAGNIYTSNQDWSSRQPVLSVNVYDSNGKFNRQMPVNTSGPIVINEQTNTIWIVNNRQFNNVSIDAYSTKYGTYISSIQLTRAVTRVSDIKRFSVDGNNGFIIADDYGRAIWAFYDSGLIFYAFSTKNFRPYNLLIDQKTQLTYVLGQVEEGLSQIQIYDTTNQLTEILSAPLGWNSGSLFGMAQDAMTGTIYASCVECNAIFAFPRSQSQSASLLPRGVTSNDFDDEVKLEEVENIEQIKPKLLRVPVPVPVSSSAKFSHRHSRSRRGDSTRRSSMRPMN